MEERLQKIMAQAGLGSRRACEEIISGGRVRVNGQVVQLGDKADPRRDEIRVDGAVLPRSEAPVYIALYKPRGVVTSADDEFSRRTVLDLVPTDVRLYPVGRLDIDSEGLVLLTNDGELANSLTHPRFGHDKEYRILVSQRPDEAQLEAFRHGVVMSDGYRTAPVQVRIDAPMGKGAWLSLVLREGRKRQIRETCSQVGLHVVRLVRLRIGTLELGGLKPGEWRRLAPGEVRALKNPPPKPAGRKPRSPRDEQRTTRPGTRRTEGSAPRRPAQRPPRSRPPVAPGKKRERASAPVRKPRAR